MLQYTLMAAGVVAPVIAGLATGVAFLVILGLGLTLPINIQLSEEFENEGQQEALDVLISSLEVRTFVAGKEFEVWLYGENYPGEPIQRNVCEINECTLIGIRERNPDGSTDCAIATYVNTNTKVVDTITYFRPCDED